MFLISQIRIFRRSEGFRLELSYYYTFHTAQRASFKIHSSWCNYPIVRVARWQTTFWRLFEFLIIIEFGTRMIDMFLKILNDVILLLFQIPTSNTLFYVLLHVKEFLITLYKIIHSIFGRDWSPLYSRPWLQFCFSEHFSLALQRAMVKTQAYVGWAGGVYHQPPPYKEILRQTKSQRKSSLLWFIK